MLSQFLTLLSSCLVLSDKDMMQLRFRVPELNFPVDLFQSPLGIVLLTF